MRNILGVLEDQGHIETINELISNFYRLRNAVDRDNLDMEKAKRLLQEFRDSVGNDPIEAAIKKKQQTQARADYQHSIDDKEKWTLLFGMATLTVQCVISGNATEPVGAHVVG